MNEIERRILESVVEVRQGDGDDAGPVLRGYAAVFGQESDDLGGFVEVIEAGAFDDVLGQDVRALWNHNNDYVLGRTVSNTLCLSVDGVGLRYEVTPPNAQWARDALETIRRGDVTQSSFAFRVDRNTWENLGGNVVRRRIQHLSRLFDVSPVTYPAYLETSAEVRAMVAQVRDSNGERGQAQARLVIARRRLELVEIEF